MSLLSLQTCRRGLCCLGGARPPGFRDTELIGPVKRGEGRERLGRSRVSFTNFLVWKRCAGHRGAKSCLCLPANHHEDGCSTYNIFSVWFWILLDFLRRVANSAACTFAGQRGLWSSKVSLVPSARVVLLVCDPIRWLHSAYGDTLNWCLV